MKATPQIFLSYAREDREKVEKLYQKLSDAGLKPWMDTKDILPGEKWKSSIHKAIRRSDFFVVCLSANSVNKRGFLQREIKDALDIWQEMLDSDIYLIPVLLEDLEDCDVPQSLRDFQWVNLFEKDGWTRLVKAIQVGMERRENLVKLSPTRERPSDEEMATPEAEEQALPDRPWWRRWAWAFLGGLIVLLLLIVGAMMAAGSVGDSSMPTPPTRETATAVTSVVLEQRTPTPSPPPPTSTPTTMPTDTPTPTRTPIPPTDAPTPTRTHIPPTATSVPPTPTPSPTAHPTSRPADYPAPVLNKPEDGANPGPNPTFSWRWDGQLQDNEYFDLRMWPEGSSDHRLGVMDFRAIPRQPSASGEYEVTTSIVKEGDRDRPAGIYYWSVVVMREMDGMRDISPEATPHKLIYVPVGGDGDDGGGGDRPLPPLPQP